MSLEIITAYEEAKQRYNERAAGKTILVMEHKGYALKYRSGPRPVLLFEERDNRVTAVLPPTPENSYLLLRRMGHDYAEGIRAMTRSLDSN